MRPSPLERGPVAAAKDETILSRHSLRIWEIRLFGDQIAPTDVRTWIRPTPAAVTPGSAGAAWCGGFARRSAGTAPRTARCARTPTAGRFR
ncbi:hypothetical protein GJE02_22590 [Mycobacterium intracellulare subsp. chimaera]|nr:hypothetical protein GJE02_22590 [Mycobacterium intracellulare subsp. chimaera]